MAVDFTSANLKKCYREAVKLFAEKFNGEHTIADTIADTIAVSAPGRVNLIGEHTDYNDGFVLPMALPLMTVIVGRKLESGNCRIVSSAISGADGDQQFPIPMHPMVMEEDNDDGVVKWIQYVKGVVALMNEKAQGKVPAFEAVVVSCVPLGKGVSSSASLEVATALFVEELLGEEVCSRESIARICQKAEHLYAGNKCGIMDQFVSLMAKKGCALMIDCKDDSYRSIPLENPDLVVLVTDTGVRHELADGEYNKRRSTCECAAEKLKERLDTQGKASLRRVTMEQFDKVSAEVLTELELKRARHVISEIQRTKEAAHILQEKKPDYIKFGQLMNESHTSLKDDYEVSCPELNKVVDIARQHKQVYGSRMTGGGFGGCTVTLLHKNAVHDVKENIKKQYKEDSLIFEASPSPGAGVIHDSVKKL